MVLHQAFEHAVLDEVVADDGQLGWALQMVGLELVLNQQHLAAQGFLGHGGYPLVEAHAVAVDAVQQPRGRQGELAVGRVEELAALLLQAADGLGVELARDVRVQRVVPQQDFRVDEVHDVGLVRGPTHLRAGLGLGSHLVLVHLGTHLGLVAVVADVVGQVFEGGLAVHVQQLVGQHGIALDDTNLHPEVLLRGHELGRHVLGDDGLGLQHLLQVVVDLLHPQHVVEDPNDGVVGVGEGAADEVEVGVVRDARPLHVVAEPRDGRHPRLERLEVRQGLDHTAHHLGQPRGNLLLRGPDDGCTEEARDELVAPRLGRVRCGHDEDALGVGRAVLVVRGTHMGP